MSSDPISELTSLLQRLEECWLDPAVAGPEEVVEMLTERQGLLDRLAEFDLGALGSVESQRVRTTLTRVAERDSELAAQTERWRNSLVSEGTRARQGRRGAEGYRRVVERIQAALERIA